MTLRKLTSSVVLALALYSGHALAAWERQAVNISGLLSGEVAVSTATSKVYIPLLQQRALAVLDGLESRRLEMDIQPTSAAYSAATGRIFVLGMFDNAVIAIDEATGAQTRIAVGSYPDNILVDEAGGKVYVSNWGGVARQGGLSVIDAATLVAHNIPMSGSITAMALDTRTGTVVVTGETGPGSNDFITAVDAQGRVIGRLDAGYRGYSLAVDSRNGRVNVGALSGSAMGGAAVNRVLTTYSLPGLRQESRIEYPALQSYHPLVFMVDPHRPGLYFAAGDTTTLRRIDGNGGLQEWNLPLGETISDGRRVVNGIFALQPDQTTGRIFVLSASGGLTAEFDPLTAATAIIEVAGSTSFSAQLFLPGGRLLVRDPVDGKFYLVQRSLPSQENALARPAKLRYERRAISP